MGGGGGGLDQVSVKLEPNLNNTELTQQRKTRDNIHTAKKNYTMN